MRQLNQRGEPEAVIRQYEGGSVISSEATLGEYVKALVKVDRLDSSALVQTLQVLMFLPYGILVAALFTASVHVWLLQSLFSIDKMA